MHAPRIVHHLTDYDLRSFNRMDEVKQLLVELTQKVDAQATVLSELTEKRSAPDLNTVAKRPRHTEDGAAVAGAPTVTSTAVGSADWQYGWDSSRVIERVLFKHEAIISRVDELAAEISTHFAFAKEEDFVVIGLLTGVFMFFSDLVRKLTVPHQVDFVAASSYGLGTISSANVKIKKDTEAPIEGKMVLVVDEMCDSGRTMACLVKLFQDRGAKSVHSCCLLDKKARRSVDVAPDFVGFTCPDEFVVGYGMDWAQRFRSLQDICVIKRSAYEK
eukprot:m.215527 g.215527  ORF g.215527 m.215527 type:complete len:274 (+) comp25621_c0_seq1:190-1011(+)